MHADRPQPKALSYGRGMLPRDLWPVSARSFLAGYLPRDISRRSEGDARVGPAVRYTCSCILIFYDSFSRLLSIDELEHDSTRTVHVSEGRLLNSGATTGGDEPGQNLSLPPRAGCLNKSHNRKRQQEDGQSTALERPRITLLSCCVDLAVFHEPAVRGREPAPH
jgi:hypothetical protein